MSWFVISLRYLVALTAFLPKPAAMVGAVERLLGSAAA